MKIKIERGIKHGCKYLNIINEYREDKRFISNQLTGSSAKTQGVFSWNSDEIWYGHQRKTFTFPTNLDLESDSATQIKKTIRDRVKLVRDWIAEIDYDETFEFEV